MDRLWPAVAYFLLSACCLVSCKKLSDPDDPMELVVSRPEIGVGIETPIRLQVRVTKDAKGETCTFKASAGSFDPDSPESTLSETVDTNGEANVLWYAPDTPGTVIFTSSIRSVYATTEIEVLPASPIVFTNLPAAIATNGTAVFTVTVSPVWERKAIEIRALSAMLRAVGPVEDELDQGTIIRPILDDNGQASILFTAPNAPMQVIITASLFGTIRSTVVQVN